MILQRVGNRGLYIGGLFEQAAQRNPDLTVTLDHVLDLDPGRGSELTVGDCADIVARAATALVAAGVRPGDKVAIFKQDGFDIFLLACAVSRAGAVPVNLSPALKGDVVAELLRRCDWPYLITDGGKFAEVLTEETKQRARAVLLASSDGDAALRLDLYGKRNPVAPSRPDPGLPALITHTSGTTGVPKLVVHTAKTLQARYRPQAVGARALIRRRETVAIHVSFVHSRLVTALAIALARGFPIVIIRDPDASHVAEILARTKPGIIEAHPNAIVAWEPLTKDPRGPLANLNCLSTTFDAIHPRTVVELLAASERKNPIHIQLYGQSEIGPTVGRVSTRKRGIDADWRCVGFPFAGMTGLRVVGADGKRPTETQPGFVEIRSDGRALTYLGEDDRYRRQLTDGWWRMGDVGYRTKWGCLHLLDREVDTIAGFGSTLAIEDTVLARMDALLEIVVIADDSGVPTPVVVTRDESPLDMGQWRDAIADLPRMREPVQLPLAQLPRTATAKVQRLALAKLLSATPGIGSAP